MCKLLKGRQSIPLLVCCILNLLPSTFTLPAKSGSGSRSLGGNLFDGDFDNNHLQSSEVPSSKLEGPIKLTVYPWNNHLGRPATIEWSLEEINSGTCKEVPSRWQGKVRSVHTHDKCFVLFSRLNCEGSLKMVKVGSPSHNRLSDICFQRKPVSTRPCTREEIEAPITDHI